MRVGKRRQTSFLVDEDCDWLIAALFHTVAKNDPNTTFSKTLKGPARAGLPAANLIFKV